ncbi:MAG TPA: hypothetical protein VI172_15705 [Candidatus Dormibacteraeota bacterium]|jgi:hypothetical protein
MTDLERIMFPNERAKLAQLIKPEDGESDAHWLARVVAGKSAVLLTSEHVRDPRRYRDKVSEATAKGCPLVIVQEDAPDTRLRMNDGAGTPELHDQAAYLAARRAGQSPDDAVRAANAGG